MSLYGIVSIIITALIACTVYPFALKYNTHMFQLNGYKNREHLTWTGKYKKRQWVLYAALVLAILWFVLRASIVADIIMWLWMLLILVVFRALCNMSAKKKLVYTARVKRLNCAVVVSDIVLIIAAALIFKDILAVKGALMLVLGLKFISCVAANIINSPMEKAINAHFINDAKRKLKEAGDMTVIGVTGSYGKTSVKYYLGELLGVKYNVLITPESYNTPMGVVRTVREHMKPGTEIFVCEMGARHVGDIKELCDLVHPDHGIIASIGPQHLDTFFTMDNIISTKFELADALPEGGMLFLNGDNEYIKNNASKYDGCIMYHAHKDAVSAADNTEDTSGGFVSSDIRLDQYGTKFKVTAPDGTSCEYEMSLIGEHNVINVTGAIAVAHSMGIALSDLKIPVRRLRPVSHRLELIRRGNLNIIDDAYNSNPVGSSAALDTLAMFDGLKVLITPGMVELGDKEEEYNRQFGRHAGEVCDHVLLVGKRRAVPIREGVLESGMDEERVRVFDKLEDAFGYAQSIRSDKEKYILLENDLPDNY